MAAMIGGRAAPLNLNPPGPLGVCLPGHRVAAQEVLVGLAQAWGVIEQGRESGSCHMDAVGRPLQYHNLRIGVVHAVVAALGAGPFHAAVGSLGQVGEAMDGLHGHGNALLSAAGLEDHGEAGAWLFGAVGPAQPDQAVLAEAGVAVQAPVAVEVAVVAEACPVAPVQAAQRPDRERARAGADLGGHRVGSRLVGRSSKAGPQGPVLGGRGVEVGSEDFGDEDDQRAADRE